MFWGLVMEPGKRYAQTVDKSFHISMACLEPNNNDNDYVPIMLDVDNQEYVLCNLHKHKGIQCQLDLNFRSGNKVAFFSSGKSRVHLTGYLIEDDEDDEDKTMDFSGDVSDLEEEEEEATPAKQNKRKPDAELSKAVAKKIKMNQLNQEDSDEDDDDDDDDDDDFGGDSDESDELSAGDSDEDEDESDDMAETQVQKNPKSKKDKLNMSMDKMNKTPNEKHKLNKTKTPIETQEQKKKKKSLNQSAIEVSTPKTPVSNEANGTHPTPHPSKKKNKKTGESPTPETPKSVSQTPGTPGKGLEKKTLQGGVFIQDLKLGNGQVAKSGKRVTVYYTGRLKQNNKQFDATTQGPGFKFQLGGGEVIKGWDIGVAGMRVGGKRKIVCPPNMAYGNKGSPPVIPPNSALVFEVELRSVN